MERYYQVIFGAPFEGVYSQSVSLAWSVVDNGSLSSSSGIGQPISLTPLAVQDINAWWVATSFGQNSACTAAVGGAASTLYYAIKHTAPLAPSMPTSTNLYVGNKIYINSTLTSTHIAYTINASGIITSNNGQCLI